MKMSLPERTEMRIHKQHLSAEANRRCLHDLSRRERHANLADRMRHPCDRLASLAKARVRMDSLPFRLEMRTRQC